MIFLEAKVKKDKKGSPVFAMGIVDDPAMDIDFVKLKASEKEATIKLSSDDKKIITGIAMRPDKWIYRDADQLFGDEGYIKFSKETIEQCATAFLANGVSDTTINHEYPSSDFALRESWIVEHTDCDKLLKLGFNDLKEGDWALSYDVLNDDTWQDAKEGKLNGFSIEGNFSMNAVELAKKADPYDEILNYIKDNLA